MPPLSGQRFCYRHAPGTVAQRRAASARGGRQGRARKAAGPVPVGTVADLQAHVGQALADTLMQANSAKRSHAVGRLIDVGRRLIEAGDLAERLAALEYRLAAMEEKRWAA